MYSSQSDASFNLKSDDAKNLTSRVYCISSENGVGHDTSNKTGKSDTPENRPSVVNWKRAENGVARLGSNSAEIGSNSALDKHTNGEPSPSGVVCVAAAPCVGGTHCLSRQNKGDGRLAKQEQPKTLTTPAFDCDTFGYQVESNPNLCGDYIYRRFQWGEKAKFYPCRRLSCANPECRKSWSVYWHNVLKQSFLTQPPTYFITISFLRTTPEPEECFGWLKSIHQKLRYRDEIYQYLVQPELGKTGNFHVRILTITTLDKKVVHRTIKHSVPTITNVEVADYYGDKALSGYFVKDFPEYAGVVIPYAYKGQGRGYPIPSKKFFSAPADDLWKEWKSQTYPQKGDVIDTPRSPRNATTQSTEL